MKNALRDERVLPIFIHSEIDDYGLSPNGFRVYAHLARRAGKDNAWPSYQSIGDHCFGMIWENAKTRRQRAMDAVRELVEKGLIDKEVRKADDGDNLTNIYRLSEPSRSVPPSTNSTPSGTIVPKGTPIEDNTYVAPQPGLFDDEEVDRPQQQTDGTEPPPVDEPFAEEMHRRIVEIQNSPNRPAALRSLYVRLYGEATAPKFSYIGAVAKKVGGAGYLASRLVEMVTRPPTGDILSYILAEYEGKQSRKMAYKTKQDPTGGVTWQEMFDAQEEDDGSYKGPAYVLPDGYME